MSAPGITVVPPLLELAAVIVAGLLERTDTVVAVGAQHLPAEVLALAFSKSVLHSHLGNGFFETMLTRPNAYDDDTWCEESWMKLHQYYLAHREDDDKLSHEYYFVGGLKNSAQEVDACNDPIAHFAVLTEFLTAGRTLFQACLLYEYRYCSDAVRRLLAGDEGIHPSPLQQQTPQSQQQQPQQQQQQPHQQSQQQEEESAMPAVVRTGSVFSVSSGGTLLSLRERKRQAQQRVKQLLAAAAAEHATLRFTVQEQQEQLLILAESLRACCNESQPVPPSENVLQLADRIINSAPATARRSRPVSSPSSAVQRPPSKTHVPRIEPSTLQREVDAFLQLPAGTEQEQQEEKQQQTAHAELPFNAGASVAFCIPAAANRVLRLLAQCHQAPAFRHLTVLKLSGCSGLTDEAAIPVLAAFSAVTDLDLSGCTAITKRTLSAITTYLPRVQILELAGLQQFVDDDFADFIRGFPVDSSFAGEDDTDRQGGRNVNFFIMSTEQRMSQWARKGAVTGAAITALNLAETQAATATCESIGERCGGLQNLCLAGCYRIKEIGITAIVSMRSRLRALNTCGCYHLRDTTAYSLIPNLRSYIRREQFRDYCKDLRPGIVVVEGDAVAAAAAAAAAGGGSGGGGQTERL